MFSCHHVKRCLITFLLNQKRLVDNLISSGSIFHSSTVYTKNKEFTRSEFNLIYHIFHKPRRLWSNYRGRVAIVLKLPNGGMKQEGEDTVINILV